MSYYMNGSEQKRERKTKLCQIKNTAGAFVFIDEHESSISDGVFFVHVPGDEGEQAAARDNATYNGAHWMNMPADRHGQAATCHSQMATWNLGNGNPQNSLPWTPPRKQASLITRICEGCKRRFRAANPFSENTPQSVLPKP